MSNILITPLMSLPNPVPGTDPGPDYANNLFNSLNIIDGHNHSPGSGNPINSSGILLNSDFPFNGFNATTLRSVRFTPQNSPLSVATDLGCLYESGVDLYFNDGNGNQIRITSGGTVNATSSGISSGTATAAFAGGVLVVDSNTNTPGNIQCGSVLIGDNTVGSNFITLSAPSALAASYPLVLPAALPGATSFVTLDSSGNVAAGGIPTANGITRANLAAVGQQVSSSCGSFNVVGSGTFATITNLSVSITVTGRPVMIFLQDDGSTSQSFFQPASAANFSFFRGSTQLNNVFIENSGPGSGVTWPLSSFSYMDP